MKLVLLQKVLSKFSETIFMKHTHLQLDFQSIRILMCLAVSNDYQLKQMNIKTAYINAPIEEDVVIKQPEGLEFLDENGKPFVCKLKKSLYGLKQSRRNCFLTLKALLIKLSFVNSFHDNIYS